MKRRFSEKLSRRRIMWAGLNIICLLLLAALLFRWNALSGLLLHEQAAPQWQGAGEQTYAQVSCYLPTDATVSETQIRTFHDALDQALVTAAISAEEGGSLWIDAYSSQAQLKVKGEYGETQAAAIGVGGDYFFFHPLFLRDGSYISGSDLMGDCVVLDEALAWKLYGSVDLAGLTVSISGQPYVIAGVVSAESDKYTAQVGDTGTRLYLSYGAFQKLTEQGITCYELVAPDPISGFALALAKDNFPLGQRGEALENTGRYDVERLIGLALKPQHYIVQANGVAYPWWENAARLVEWQLILLLPLLALALAVPLVSLTVLIVRFSRRQLARWREWRRSRDPERWTAEEIADAAQSVE